MTNDDPERLHTGRTRDDHVVYLADPVVPAHSLEAGSSQDDGSKVVLLIQLLETRVQVPTLERPQLRKNTSETDVHSGLLAPFLNMKMNRLLLQ